MTFAVHVLNNINQDVLNKLDPESYTTNENLDEATALLVRSKDLHQVNLPDSLLYIGRAGTGTNNIPIDKCSQEGIVVCNAPGANANGVKEMVILAMILASRNVLEAISWTNALEAETPDLDQQIENGKKQFVGRELLGKKVGVIGLGSIGGRVANMLVDFGMEVYGYDPYVTLRSAWGLDSRVHYTEDLSYIFQVCDFVTIHVPLTDDNHHLISESLIQQAKEGMILINMARDGLVDLKALKPALESGKIGKYVVDFPESTSLKLKNTINIPHLGASTPESQTLAAKMVVNQMTDYLENGNILNSVNFPTVQAGVCRTNSRLCILHRNRPNLINNVLNCLSKSKNNIASLYNNHKNEWAYTIIDLDQEIHSKCYSRLHEIPDVVRVRIIQGKEAKIHG